MSSSAVPRWRCCCQFYPSVSYTSDYRYNGVSYSGGDPVPQASLHWIGSRG